MPRRSDVGRAPSIMAVELSRVDCGRQPTGLYVEEATDARRRSRPKGTIREEIALLLVRPIAESRLKTRAAPSRVFGRADPRHGPSQD